MQKIIPIYYKEYGQYITRFRAIPFFIDCLKPVERRILLTLHEIAKDHFVKSARIVGHCISKYHPHGDQSVYSTLVNLVNQQFAIGKGNWGSPGLVDAEAAAYRYTEAKINPVIEKIAFEYIDHVPYEELELESEPLYLPSPIPLGLIGNGVITGIAFHKTLIPKYTLNDLIQRLIFLLEENKDQNLVIKPNILNCSVFEENSGEFLKILKQGNGTIVISPDGDIQDGAIRIKGRCPNSTFNSLINDKDQLEIYLNDLSKKEILVEIIPKRKRSIDLQQLAAKIWDKYLIKKLNIICNVCDYRGSVKTVGIDDLLINNYQTWKTAVLNKNIHDYNKLIDKKKELFTVQIIRYIFEQYKSTTVNEVVEKFKFLTKNNSISIEVQVFEDSAWKNKSITINEEDLINVCNKRNIRNLIENKIDIEKIDINIKQTKLNIDRIDELCYRSITDLKNLKFWKDFP